MAVLIKGMQMPENGYECAVCNDGLCAVPPPDSDGICLVFGPGDEKRPSWCPLVPVPSHGRLIDAHTLHTVGYEIYEKYADRPAARTALQEIEKLIIAAPVIIEEEAHNGE